VASIGFVLLRLVESWRVSPGSPSHRITVFGARLSYPTANLDAVVVLAFAVLALTATCLAVQGAVTEVLRSSRFRRALDRRCQRRCDDVSTFEDPVPLAFCAGFARPGVYVSTGALELLDEQALDAVLAHERHHARRRDPLRLAVGRVLARSLFFVPGIAALVRGQAAITELSADESVLRASPAHRAALAQAMLSFSDAATPTRPVGFAPARIDYLLGQAPNWRFPTLLCAAAAGVTALLAAVTALAARAAAGSATLSPPFLSRQPCVVVLAMIPALAAGVAAFALLRQRRRVRQAGERRAQVVL
jgi:beta-lactamase regulating signal transducer with metallopeptidase domain